MKQSFVAFIKRVTLGQVLGLIIIVSLSTTIVIDYLIYLGSQTTPSASDPKTGVTLDEKTYQQILDAQKTDITIKHSGTIGKDNPFDPLP